MDPTTLASIAIMASRTARMLADYNSGVRTPEQIQADWDALGVRQEVTAKLLRDAAAQGGYTVPD